MSTNSQYRAFKQEMMSLAGYHTGENLVLDETYMNNNAILLHEKAHGQIFDETLDGKLHKCVMLCIRERIHPKHNSSLAYVNDFLFEDTRIPHERAATFLGIVGLPKLTDMQDARAELDKEYNNYFTYFSEFLPWSNSSFLSFLIANSIVRFAFNSERFSKISDMSTLTVANLQSVESPHQRMDLAKKIFIEGDCASRGFIQTISEAIMRTELIEPYDLFDDSAWENRINSGATDTSVVERRSCEIFEHIFSTQSSLKVYYENNVPQCFEAISNLVPSRKFNLDFPLIDGVVSLTEDAASYFAKEADRNLISRSIFTEIPRLSFDYFLNHLEEYLKQDICIVFVQINGQPEQFKMFTTVVYEGENNFAPGSGVVIDIHTLAEFAFHLGQITIQCNMISPLFYIVYVPGAPDETGLPIHLPQVRGIVKTFFNHMTANKQPVPGQGVLIRPLIYGRPFWSRVISDAIGDHIDYSILLYDEDEEKTNEFWAQILIPRESPPGIPVISILDKVSRSAYRSSIKYRVLQGYLRSKKETVISRGLSECLYATWETLPFI